MSTYPIGGAYSPWRDATALALRLLYEPPSAQDARVVRQAIRCARRERSGEGALVRDYQYRRPRIFSPLIRQRAWQALERLAGEGDA